MITIEVELKALIGGEDNANILKDKIKELGGEYQGVETQKNFYYLKPEKNTLEELSQRFAQFEDILKHYENSDTISLRIRKINDDACLLVAKISLSKSDAANGVSRIEIEKRLDFESIDALGAIFEDYGLKVQSKWSRTRETYSLNNCTVTIDYNAGYGYVCEVEKTISSDQSEYKAEEEVKVILHELGLTEIDPERLNRMFIYYNNNWQKYYNTQLTFNIA